MSARPVIQFPVTVVCPTCGKPCSDEDLSECLRCGQQYCSKDSWECACDRQAEEIHLRAERPGALSRVLSRLF